MDAKTERRTLVVVAVLGVAVLAVGGIGLAGLKRVDRRETCLWNLSRTGIVVLAAESKGPAAWDRIGTGRRFFLEFTDWPGPPPFPVDPVWFCCPEVGPPQAGRIDYRGPASPMRNYAATDPIAADRAGNHRGGGNVVLRNGSARSVEENDSLWAKAAAATSEN